MTPRTSETTTLLVADDREMVRAGLCALLECEPNIKVVGEAADGREAVRVALEIRPDIVVIAALLPRQNGIDAAREIGSSLVDTRVIGLADRADRALVTEMLRAGAAGFVTKTCPIDVLVTAIRAVANGKKFLCPCVTGFVIDGPEEPGDARGSPLYTQLTSREREVLQLLAEGGRTRAIATTLNLSPKTVDTHRRNAMRKLRLETVAELVRIAISEGLVPLSR